MHNLLPLLLLTTAPLLASACSTHASEGTIWPVGERPKAHQFMGWPGVEHTAEKATMPLA